jgi:hypothetical protein
MYATRIDDGGVDPAAAAGAMSENAAMSVSAA